MLQITFQNTFLKKVNDQLMEENNKLHNLLNNKKAKVKTDKNQKYISAKIINNSIHKRDNFITINKGKRHGIKDGMGVICGQWGVRNCTFYQ